MCQDGFYGKIDIAGPHEIALRDIIQLLKYSQPPRNSEMQTCLSQGSSFNDTEKRVNQPIIVIEIEL